MLKEVDEVNNTPGRKNIIIYVGGFELPDKNAAAQRCISNAKIFRDLGYEVILLGVDKSQKRPLNRFECFGFSCWSVPYPASGKSWLLYITSLNQVNFLLEHEYKDKVFAVICYNHPAISQYRIRAITKKYGALALADVTEWYSAAGNQGLRKLIKWLDTSLRMRWVNCLMDGLITTSGYLTDFYKKQKDLVELPTLYDKSQIVQREVPEKNEPNKCYKLMYAGSPFDVPQAVRSKSCVKERLDLVVKTLFQISLDGINFELKIFGVSKENYLKVYPEDIEKLEILKNKVLFMGWCPHQRILENIVISDFTIFLRDISRVTQAGFPSKFAESITYGTPVITNLISNIEPYVTEGKNCYLVDLDDSEKRVEELKLILSLPPEDVLMAKKICFDSVNFDYRSFIGKIKFFLTGLKGENGDETFN